jgi:hypothetical protein
MKHHFVGEFGEWVLQLAPWQAFGTFTFQFEMTTRGAANCFENQVARHLPGVRCFYSVEMHPGGHGGHVHALFANLGEFESQLSKKGQRVLVTEIRGVNFWKLWFDRYGRNSIELPRDVGACGRYVASYMTKEAAHWNHNLTGEFVRRETEIETLARYVFPGATVLSE